MAASDAQSTLSGLAAKVKELSDEFTNFLTANKIQAPTMGADSCTFYSGLTPESFLLRQQLLDTLMDMYYLTQGPSESIFNYVHNVRLCSSALTVSNVSNRPYQMSHV